MEMCSNFGWGTKSVCHYCFPYYRYDIYSLPLPVTYHIHFRTVAHIPVGASSFAVVASSFVAVASSSVAVASSAAVACIPHTAVAVVAVGHFDVGLAPAAADIHYSVVDIYFHSAGSHFADTHSVGIHFVVFAILAGQPSHPCRVSPPRWA